MHRDSAPRTIALHELAPVLGVTRDALLKWRAAGIIDTATTPSRGRGVATLLTRDQAREAAAIALTRRGGAPLQQVAAIARRLRQSGRRGRAFYALRANRATALVPEVDLRDLAPAIEAELDRLEARA